LYLRIKSPDQLASRVLASGRGFDYWESGMDLGLADDYYDSFVAYQKLLLKEFERMSGEYGFQIIDASRPIRRVANELRRAVSRVIDSESPAISSAKETVKAEVQVKPKPSDGTIVKESSKAAS
jgi:hypothetical protein